MKKLSEESVLGFVFLSAFFGFGAGTMMFHFVKDLDFCDGFGLVVGIIALLVMLFVAKLLACFEKDEDEEEDEEE